MPWEGQQTKQLHAPSTKELTARVGMSVRICRIKACLVRAQEHHALVEPARASLVDIFSLENTKGNKDNNNTHNQNGHNIHNDHHSALEPCG